MLRAGCAVRDDRHTSTTARRRIRWSVGFARGLAAGTPAPYTPVKEESMGDKTPKRPPKPKKPKTPTAATR